MTQARRLVSAGILVCTVLLPQGAAPARAAAAASPLIVTTTADLTPPCVAAAYSLRCALRQANADGTGATITFQIPATDAGCAGSPAVCTITPLQALPPLTATNTLINGYSQPGAAPNSNPLSAGDNAVLTLHLDGSRAGQGVDGLDVSGARDTIAGLSITGFQLCTAPAPGCPGIPGQQRGGSALGISGIADVVVGTFLGVAPDGLTALPNQFAGVNIISVGAPVGGALVGGATPAASNLISGNGQCVGGDCEGFGVYVNAGSGSVIARNYIGTTASGRAALGNKATAVVILTPRNVLGGTSQDAGNVVSGNGGDAVLVGGSGTLIQGNLIGTNAAGTAAVGNGSHGLDIQASGTVIRGNVISANGDTGVVLLGSGSVVQGNRIGTDAAGMIALGNGLHPSAIFQGQPINGTDGLVTCAGANLIGGTAAGSANLIGGNGGDGISLVSSGNLVQGNRVGSNAFGTAALPNHGDGIGSLSNALRGSGFCQQAPNVGGSNNTIGGTATGAGNLVSGNSGNGIVVLGTHNTVAGNGIGTTATGTAALGNGGAGVLLTAVCNDGVCQASSTNSVGGTGRGAGNLISGNSGDGVLIDGLGKGSGNSVQGNSIGTDPTGTVPLGNHGNGVVLLNGAVDDSVGGTGAGAANLIAYNGAAGVLIGGGASDTGTHDAVQQNAILANGGLGIDVAPQGTVNCATPPPGPNDYTPCPVIQSATATQVSGTACATCAVEVFRAVSTADDQGHGEGAIFLGRVTASQTGTWSLSLTAGQVSLGQQVTATATTPVAFNAAAETSEFALNHVVR